MPFWRMPSWMTLVSETDSTVSGRTGAGRTLDRFLSAGGRSLEALLATAGGRLGLGPTAQFVRFFRSVELLGVGDCRACDVSFGKAPFADGARALAAGDVLAIMLRWPCQVCLLQLRNRLATFGSLNRGFDRLCTRLVRHMRYESCVYYSAGC
jgi:hypothetical protein